MIVGLLASPGVAALVSDQTAGAPTEGAWLRSPTIDTGMPLLRNFSSKSYAADPQNWAMVQDPRGLIYVGNGDGLLEFDGGRWRLIRLANRTNTARSLAVDGQGRVYVGAVGEIGYLQPDAYGQARYVSLLNHVPAASRDFAEVEHTFVTPQGIVFATGQRLMRIQGEHFQEWKSASMFRRAYWVGDRLFIREVGRGLLELIDDELRMTAEGERFANEGVFAMLPGPALGKQSTLLIGTQTQGFLLFDGRSFAAWPTAIDAELRRDLPYQAIRLPSGSLAVGTMQNGIYLLDAQGKLLTHISNASGLPDNSVWALALDREGGLWLGLSRGLTRVELSNPVSRFDERNGLPGTVRAIHRHLGRLFVGTNQGVYVLEPDAEKRFRRIAGIDGQTRDFLSLGESLLMANYQGVYEWRGEQAKLLYRSVTSWALHAPKAQPDRVLVGLSDGLVSLRRVADQWQDEGHVPGITSQIRSLLEDRDGMLWLGTRSNGLLRLRIADLNARGSTPLLVEHFGRDEGLPSLNWNVVFPMDGEARFTTEADGIYRYIQSTRRFERDPRFTGLFAEQRALFSREQDPRLGIWIASEEQNTGLKETGLAALQNDGSYRWDARHLGALVGSDITAIHVDADGIVWFGGEDGLFRYDPRIVKDNTQPFNALLRQVSDPSGKVHYGGSGAHTALQLEHASNKLRFEYAALSFDDPEANRFQVKLEGSDRNWSIWSAEHYKDYSNLFEGDYRFRVRAKNLYGTLSEEAIFDVSVLPPWYRTAWSYLAYALVLAGCGWAILRWRLRRLWAKKRVLEGTVAKRTLELEVANAALLRANAQIERASLTDPLTDLGNRRGFVGTMERRRNAAADTSTPTSPRSALLLVDIDHFKSVNDNFGHAAGDTLLKSFAELLRQNCREHELAVRWGGEEFLLEVAVADEPHALLIGNRLREAVERENFDLSDGRSTRCTCSIGIACMPLDASAPKTWGWEQVLAVADSALYVAKRSGRNAAVCLAANGTLPEDFEQAIARGSQQLIDAGVLRMLRSP
jgi:diguanylate cyclase (GGDEF)-like protein